MRNRRRTPNRGIAGAIDEPPKRTHDRIPCRIRHRTRRRATLQNQPFPGGRRALHRHPVSNRIDRCKVAVGEKRARGAPQIVKGVAKLNVALFIDARPSRGVTRGIARDAPSNSGFARRHRHEEQWRTDNRDLSGNDGRDGRRSWPSRSYNGEQAITSIPQSSRLADRIRPCQRTDDGTTMRQNEADAPLPAIEHGKRITDPSNAEDRLKLTRPRTTPPYYALLESITIEHAQSHIAGVGDDNAAIRRRSQPADHCHVEHLRRYRDQLAERESWQHTSKFDHGHALATSALRGGQLEEYNETTEYADSAPHQRRPKVRQEARR